jgi:hypothetical protein
MDQPGVQGDWVGVYGSRGYDLAAWNKTSDLVSMPNVTVTVLQGTRTRWSSATTAVRALENPSQTQRRAAAYTHATEVRVRLNFSAAFTGTVNLYVVDWDSTARRATVSVDDGMGAKSLGLTTSFANGAWLHFPVSVVSGGTVTIRVTRTAGSGAVLSGIMLN